MNLFKRKPGYVVGPLDWIWTGGRSNRQAACSFLNQIESISKHSSPGNRLYCYRNDFRRLIADHPIDVFLISMLDRDPLTRAVAVWLTSREASRFLLLDIDRRCDDPSPLVRKHVAKALHRLEARQLLREMAERYPEEPAVQWYAQAKPNAVEFRDRLKRFSENSDHSQIEPAARAQPMTLWSRFENWLLSPPKSRSYMRRVLKRVRRAVRGI